MISFLEWTPETLESELEIVNSNRFYNRVAYDKDELALEELRQEIEESLNAGAVRLLMMDGEEPVGLLEYLPRNPNDGYPWLGLLEIKAGLQNKGYGRTALNEFYAIMRDRGIEEFRIGVILENEPAHRFWRSKGFKEVAVKPWGHKQVIVYEQKVPTSV